MRWPSKTDFAILGEYADAVFKHFVSFAWFVIAGGFGVASEFVGSLRFVPTWAWWVIALAGLTVAQFRTYQDARGQLASALARAGDLDTAEAKRAYLEGTIAEARKIRDEIAEFGAHWPTMQGLNADVSHWEDVVRAELRRSFPAGTAIFFDSEQGFEIPDHLTTVQSQTGAAAYLARRITRLEQIRDGQMPPRESNVA